MQEALKELEKQKEKALLEEQARIKAEEEAERRKEEKVITIFKQLYLKHFFLIFMIFK